MVPMVDQSNAHLLFENHGDTYKLKKNFQQIEFAGSLISSNQFGYRDQTMKRQSSHKRRVAFIGDSWGFGWGFEEVESIPKRVAKKINGEVLNFSIPGFNVRDYSNTIEKELPKFDIDEVVVLLHLNDILEMNMERNFSSKDIHETKFLVYELFQRSLLAPLAEFLKLTNKSSVKVFNRAYSKENKKLALYTTFLKKMIESSKRNKQEIKFFILPIPFANSDNYPLFHIHQQLLELLNKLGARAFDLSPVYKGKRKSAMTINSYDPHPNSFASKLLAEEILKIIK
ncbi:hypothetical protein A9Q84_19500 [Halobacteriovorax marinus]|uniref:SGNH hydrolase-type esterase domain-containing protein n=1 Tax=Halobacteriovorax marinus TaxID=97084 RepID=A0A1Y5F2J1_9BACT|nr:hypothetical protein A9Q84_19500 [Halobacteriovorax marinus]